MTTSSHARFVSLTRTLKRVREQGDVKAMQALMVSDAFTRDVLALGLEHRSQILTLAADQLSNMKRWVGPLVPMVNNKAPKWNEVLIARLRAADEKYGDDELIARALRLPVRVVARARLRYVGKRTPVAPATPKAVEAA